MNHPWHIESCGSFHTLHIAFHNCWCDAHMDTDINDTDLPTLLSSAVNINVTHYFEWFKYIRLIFEESYHRMWKRDIRDILSTGMSLGYGSNVNSEKLGHMTTVCTSKTIRLQCSGDDKELECGVSIVACINCNGPHNVQISEMSMLRKMVQYHSTHRKVAIKVK